MEQSLSRSRGSLASRRTPSGIPFFSRKSSSASIEREEEPQTPVSVDESDDVQKSGRKSILGINYFTRRKSASSTASAASATPKAAVSRPTPKTSELQEPRPPAGSRTISDEPARTPTKGGLLGRKRGKASCSLYIRHNADLKSRHCPALENRLSDRRRSCRLLKSMRCLSQLHKRLMLSLLQ